MKDVGLCEREISNEDIEVKKNTLVLLLKRVGIQDWRLCWEWREKYENRHEIYGLIHL